MGDLLQKCDDKGQWADTAACDTGLCSKDAGMCLKCKPDAPTGCADDHTKNVCDSSGMSESPVACPVTKQHCVMGQCVECVAATDCPPSSVACMVAACIDNKCGVQPADSGADSSMQTPGDCKKIVCDGKGGTLEQTDPTDPKPDDGNPCTAETCNGDTPTTTNVAPGMACTLGGVDGVCTGTGLCADCVPKSTRCTGNQLETCSAQGKWEASNCQLPTQVCSAGACVGVKTLAAGDNHTCAVLTDGAVRCWGSNENGQIGNGNSGLGVKETRPVSVSDLAKAKSISLGSSHSCALLEDTTIACWGLNSSGQLGVGPDGQSIQPKPGKVKDLQGVTNLDLGGLHSCAIKDDGSLWCWGNNEHGQLGLGMVGKQISPQQLFNVVSAKTVSAGGTHTCALSGGGPDVVCWGDDSSGQVGNGKNVTGDQSSPVPTSLLGAKFVASGGAHSCGISSTSQVLCWGEDHQQQLGDETGGQGDVNQPSPVASFFKPSTLSLSLGGQHTCALLTGGSVECVGANTLGQLGNGSTNSPFPGQPLAPTPVMLSASTVLTGVVELVAGGNHNCVRLDSGEVMCWGSNQQGQLGVVQTVPGSVSPMPVAW